MWQRYCRKLEALGNKRLHFNDLRTKSISDNANLDAAYMLARNIDIKVMLVGFVKLLREFADYRDKGRPSIDTATVAVTEKYARKVLGVKKDEPLVYRGLRLRCIGSKLWRDRRTQPTSFSEPT
jgi:hypothetical protein